MKRRCLFIALFIALQTFFYNFHLSEAELFDELLTLEVFYLAIYAACNILPRGYSWEFLLGVCPGSPNPEPFSDQKNVIFHTRF